MATEVTKLISVSLGKMQQSRQTKSGPNLRKSLLVASVLHKARDIYITENKNRRSHRQSTETYPEPVVKRRFTSQSSIDETRSNMEEGATSISAATQVLPSNKSDDSNLKDDDVSAKHKLLNRTLDVSDNKNTAPTTATLYYEKSGSRSLTSDSVLDELASAADETVESHSGNKEVDKENFPPLVVDTTPKQTCHRCLKRRLSIDTQEDTATDSTQTNDEGVTTKRFKATDHSALLPSTTVICDSSSSAHQINNLVRIFSQSIPEFNSSVNRNSFSSSKDRPSELLTFAVHLRESIALTA